MTQTDPFYPLAPNPREPSHAPLATDFLRMEAFTFGPNLTDVQRQQLWILFMAGARSRDRYRDQAKTLPKSAARLLDNAIDAELEAFGDHVEAQAGKSRT